MLDRQTILSADDLARETVSVPEWGGDVGVRVLTAAEKVALTDRISPDGETGDLAGFLARLVVMAACDDAGKRLFTTEDAHALQQKSSVALERVADVAMRLNAMRVEDREAMAKNSMGSANST